MTTGDTFHLSARSIDFGWIPADATEWRSLIIFGAPDDGGSEFVTEASESWIAPVLGSYTRDGRELLLAVDGARLPGVGTHRATVHVRCGNQTETCEVVAHFGTRPASPTRAQRRRSPAPRRKPASKSEGTSSPLPAGSAAAPLPPEAILSLFLSLLGLTCILGGFYASTVVLLGADASGDSGPPTTARITAILVVWMGTCLAYLLFAFRWMLLHSSGLAGQRQGTQNDAEVQQILDDLCEGSKISRPRLRIVDSAVPNTRSVGLSPSFGHLEISRGLIDAVVATGGPDALRAVLAHELVHLRLFDTFFFTIIGPPLAVARGLLTVLSRARTAVGQFGQGFNAGPFVVLAMLTKGSPLGCLVALLAGALLIGCLSVTLFYAASLVGVLMGMVALCLAYSRFVEQRADCRAVEMLGSSRGMVDALAACLPAYPGEMTRVHRYAKTYLPDIAAYTPDHLLASLAAGGDPDVGTPAAERLFRTHPPFMRRLACLAATESQLTANEGPS